MLHYAIDRGVNYLDTGYGYHGGNSERFLGRALKGGYRAKVKLATKFSPPRIETIEDCERMLNEQLERMQTEHIDLYLMHGLGAGDRWPRIRDLRGVFEWADGAIADGRIGHLGFSFHGEYDLFKEIINAYDNWTLCQIQYNYMDIENQAGTKGLRYAASKGLAVVIMEPLLGGRLVDPPEPIQKLWDTAAVKRKAADWALQWLWNQPEVSGVDTLREEELAIYDQVRAKYQELCPFPCTQCAYCMPCPNGVDIPHNFQIYNHGKMYDKPSFARRQYAWIGERYQQGLLPENPQAGECIQCRECEDKCPQSIPISEWMPIVHQVLGEGQPYDAGRFLTDEGAAVLGGKGLLPWSRL